MEGFISNLQDSVTMTHEDTGVPLQKKPPIRAVIAAALAKKLRFVWHGVVASSVFGDFGPEGVAPGICFLLQTLQEVFIKAL